LMTIIEIWPNKFSNQNFVRQGLSAKRQMVPFRLISLKYFRPKKYVGYVHLYYSYYYVGFVPAKAPSNQRPTANNTHITMAAAARNGPLAPPKRPKIPLWCVRSMGDDAPSKRICFSPAMSRSKALKTLIPMARRDSSPSLPHHRSILRALDRLIAREKQIHLLGALSPINLTRMRLKLDFICGGRGRFPGATAMVVVSVVSLRQDWKAY
jgi:hypothetical protein